MFDWSWPEFDQLFRRLERDFSDLLGRTITPTMTSGSSTIERRLVPPIEVLRKDGELAVRVELPGVDPEKVDVSVESNVLRIRAEKQEGLAEGVQVLRREMPFGTYERHLTLPEGAKADGLAARFTNGLLEIVIPFEGGRIRKVPVEIGSGTEQKELVGATS
jgi:HSP20 family protein